VVVNPHLSDVARRSRLPLVLCYHAVSETWTDPLAVPPTVLERQVRKLLARGFTSVAAADVFEGRRSAFHVTFDDAYRNVASVIPILEAHAIRATVFACAAYADDGAPLLIPELRFRAAGHEDELRTLDWDGLRELAERGHEIGSHTNTHPHLTRLSDVEALRELAESRERVSDHVGRPCRFLAYPFGENDDRIRKHAAAAGYAAAFALRAGDRPVDPFAMPRFDIYRGDGRARFRLKTSRARRPLVRLLDLRRLSRSAGSPRG
jgi:peptidoglycan/xylan/chitin deacetylase (PgdA/CDA1 family)